MNFIQLQLVGTVLTKSCEFSEDFAKYFETVYNSSHLGNFCCLLL
jgi:hypothetical protein